MVLTTSFDIGTNPLIPEYDSTVWGQIKQAAINGNLFNTLELGQRFGIPVTRPTLKEGYRGPYTLPFRVVHLTSDEAIFSNAGHPGIWNSTGLNHVLPSEVQSIITGDIFQATYTDVFTNFEYYSSDEKRIKAQMDGNEISRNASGEIIGIYWIFGRTGVPNAQTGTTYYINHQGKFSSTGNSLAAMWDVSFRIDNT